METLLQNFEGDSAGLIGFALVCGALITLAIFWVSSVHKRDKKQKS